MEATSAVIEVTSVETEVEISEETGVETTVIQVIQPSTYPKMTKTRKVEPWGNSKEK